MKLVLMGASFCNSQVHHNIYQLNDTKIYLSTYDPEENFIQNRPYLSYRQIVDKVKESL
jgi:hypothetical protein